MTVLSHSVSDVRAGLQVTCVQVTGPDPSEDAPEQCCGLPSSAGSSDGTVRMQGSKTKPTQRVPDKRDEAPHTSAAEGISTFPSAWRV